MLAGLASQAAASGGFTNAVIAFTVAATATITTLTVAAITLAAVSQRRLADIGTHGSHVKRVTGAILIAIGLWFAYLAAANPTYLLP